ncbi:DUF4393 domain-containing protein [Xanthomonas euvesicatoria]|uniref:DUF4393 domain-containing protein n=1 Tax=Xanthomonas TaxID=338 RepID=UPI003556D612
MAEEEKPFASAQASVVLVGELMKAAGNDPNVKEAAGNLGKAAVTLSRTINNALLPLAAVNFAFDKARAYFEGNFQNDVAERAASIPLESLQEPKASVAGPALQALAFTHEEKSLKDMFLGLLATAMDSRRSELAHPAFVEIIKQLDAGEAKHLIQMLKSKVYVPIVSVERRGVDGGQNILARHLVDLIDSTTREPIRLSRFPAMLENWSRLGLVDIRYDAWIKDDSAYNWVEVRPEYLELKGLHESPENSVSFSKGYVHVTHLGAEFAEAIAVESL